MLIARLIAISGALLLFRAISLLLVVLINISIVSETLGSRRWGISGRGKSVDVTAISCGPLFRLFCSGLFPDWTDLFFFMNPYVTSMFRQRVSTSLRVGFGLRPVHKSPESACRWYLPAPDLTSKHGESSDHAARLNSLGLVFAE